MIDPAVDRTAARAAHFHWPMDCFEKRATDRFAAAAAQKMARVLKTETVCLTTVQQQVLMLPSALGQTVVSKRQDQGWMAARAQGPATQDLMRLHESGCATLPAAAVPALQGSRNSVRARHPSCVTFRSQRLQTAERTPRINHRISLGAETPKTERPDARTVRTESTRASRAIVNSLSFSMTKRKSG